MLYSLSQLNSDKLKAIQNLEKDLGSPVLALSPIPVDPATLPESKLQKLKDLEQKLGVLLVTTSTN